MQEWCAVRSCALGGNINVTVMHVLAISNQERFIMGEGTHQCTQWCRVGLCTAVYIDQKELDR